MSAPPLRFKNADGREFPEWEVDLLGNHAETIQSGKSNARNDNGKYIFYGSTGAIGYANSFEYQGNKILIARVGNAGYLYEVNGDYCVSDNTLMLTLKKRNNYSFFFNLLTNENLSKLVFGSAQPLITGGHLKNLNVAIPSFLEQTKIASFLTTIDEKITQLTQKCNLLAQYKKGVMQQIFSQELRFKDDNRREFSEWEETRLSDVCDIKKGKQLNKEELTKFDIYPVINGGQNPSGYTDIWNTKENTVTISEGGNSCGFVNFIKNKFWAGGHCYTLMKLKNGVNNHFLFQILKFNEPSIMRLRVGSGLPNIQKTAIGDFLVLIPESEKEQTKIANFLTAIDNKITHTQTQLKAVKQYKKGLLQQMFI